MIADARRISSPACAASACRRAARLRRGSAAIGNELLEQILAGHSQVFGAGELCLARDGFAAACEQRETAGRQSAAWIASGIQRLALRHLEELQRRNATALRVVDKMPDNYLYLDFWRCFFPGGSSTAGATCTTWPYRAG